MRHDTKLGIRYLTERPVPVRDVIDSLQGIESVLVEVAYFLPEVVHGLKVEKIELRVREISQESPLRELFLVSLFLAFQEDLEREVAGAYASVAGEQLPPNIDTIFTITVLVLVFYGVAAIKDLVVDKATKGPARRMLDGLISELAVETGCDGDRIRAMLETRYGDKTLWKRIANATSRFFSPSKRQNSAPVEVNERPIRREVVQDVPAQYLIDHEADVRPSRNFQDVVLELHAQDRDHAGKGWAAIPRSLSEQRLRLKLMKEVSTTELWGHDVVRGDITIVYEKVGAEMVAKEIHLHRVTGIVR